MTTDIRFVGLVDAEPLGDRLLKATSDNPGTLVVVGGGDPARVPTSSLYRLLTGHYGIGVVVQADALPPDGARPWNHDISVRSTNVQGLAILSGTLARVPLLQGESDVTAVWEKILLTVERLGRRIVTERTWQIERPGESGRWQQDLEPTEATEVLVMAGELSDPRLDWDSRAMFDLIDDLADASANYRLSVMMPTRTKGTALDYWTNRGIAVFEGPPSRFDAAMFGRFTHVIVTPRSIWSGARRWIDRTQPTAERILLISSIPETAVARLRPVTPPDELGGLDHLKSTVRATVDGWLEWANKIWCLTRSDAVVLEGAISGAPVQWIPLRLTTEPSPGFEERSGVVVAATRGHDVLAGNEDSAVKLFRDLVPLLSSSPAEMTVKVLADRPSPMLTAAVSQYGAQLVEGSNLDTALTGSRVLIAGHGFGKGQPEILARCLELGTPFVVAPYASGNLDLGRLGANCTFASIPDLATHTRRLLTDPTAWGRNRNLAADLVLSVYSPQGRRAALRQALAVSGIVAGRPQKVWPHASLLHDVPVARLLKMPIRPDGESESPEVPSESEPTDEVERYRAWVARNGPTPRVLHSLASELEKLPYRPCISILMPVFNTEPDVLHAAVNSVKSQLYDNWQLCIADDGSTNPETTDALSMVSHDERIMVIALEGGNGISGTTNAALAAADGEFVTFLDHDDVLKPHALAQVVRWLNSDPNIDVLYSDEDKIDGKGQLYDPHIKPDWSPDQLTAQNYVCHMLVARRAIVASVGGLRSEFDGSQDYDLILRISEMTSRIAHIPEPLYSWRAVQGSAAADPTAKPYAIDAQRRALSAALRRRGYQGNVEPAARLGCFRPRYEVAGSPRVTIIIPTRDGLHLLRRCVDSIIEKTTYSNYEIMVIDNQSKDPATLGYLASLPVRVVRYPERFNYSRMMNLAAVTAECDALLFLNNDTEVITPEWIESLVEHALRPEVGAVGCRLRFGNGNPQHEGIALGICGGWAGNLNHGGYWGRGDMIRNTSAVTGACTMIRPDVYWEVGGNDERLRIAYNDVDICLRIRQAGYQIVYTPYAELFHHESSTRAGHEHEEDGPLFGIRWHPRDSVDDYYSPMFDPKRPFVLKV